ncbi:hypothetical protein J437_LFUL014877 [Ladona fulva]|uniref:CHK kinase-like domain-containing protein n=1 Tax=Ladona fulva TaxID=123851 RepID=A0A8K0KJX0_LADFU|nr:hypothetical protein J437_LFUL014877 [Ladona fulva]
MSFMNDDDVVMDRQDWIREKVVKNILESYAPWKGAELIKSEVEFIEGKKDNFASTTYSVTLQLKIPEDGYVRTESHPLFLKLIVDNPILREALQSEKQFFNEILWYSEVVPKFQYFIDGSKNRARPLNLFPKCYYSHYDDIDAVIALEDLRPRNFVLGDRVALGVKYVEKALEAVARSHALAYRWKETDERKFLEVASSFKEASINRPIEPMLKLANERVYKALEKDPEYTERVQKFKEITADPWNLMQALVRPEGPLATICHGDFCRNNILYSERVMNGESIIESVLIDFQTARYASPAIDLSFFIFMNTTPELRAAEFDRLFTFYYDTIIKELKDLTGLEEVDVISKREKIFTLQAFKDDFASHAIYGYFITSFFLPVMMVDDKERDECTRMWESQAPGYESFISNLGGELVTARLVAILKEVLDRNYLPK